MNTSLAPTVFDRMSALGDTARGRMLVLLEEGELTVSELVRVLQLPQSTVSRHLKVLADGGWVSSRTSGTSRYYRVAGDLGPDARDLWALVRADVVGSGLTREDAERAVAVRIERRSRSREFFATQAGQWDALRDELFGRHLEHLPLLGLLDGDWVLGDLGSGTGGFAASVAPYVERVIGVDASPEMLDAARTRVAGLGNVEMRAGELEQLPIEDGSLDVATMLLVLHHIAEPTRVIANAARALKPGGRLIVVDMRRHERDEYLEQMGHQWPGFTPQDMKDWMDQAGLSGFRYTELRPQEAAKGPLLFTCTARRPN